MSETPEHSVGSRWRKPLAPFRLLGKGFGQGLRGALLLRNRVLPRRWQSPPLASVHQQNRRSGPLSETDGQQCGGPLGLFRSRTPSAVSGEEFPERVCSVSQSGGSARCREIAAVGSRQWGNWWDGRPLLKVKLYDFAVYFDPKQAKTSKLRSLLENNGLIRNQKDFYRDLTAGHDVEMSLLVRASRNLPIKLLSREYKSILSRRIVSVGGSPDDAALHAMVDCFREDVLPASVKEGGSVRKGTVLTFTRDGSGRLTALANEHTLADVHSRDLCAAVFSLYLGDNPVSKSAKAVAADSFARMVNQPHYTPSPLLQAAAGLRNRAEGDEEGQWKLGALLPALQ